MSATTAFVSPPGGVMTAGREGAISGDLWLRVREGAGHAHVEVAYAETDDWYLVQGGALPLVGSLAADAGVTLAQALSADPGVDGDGNARPTDLEQFNAARIQVPGRLPVDNGHTAP